MGTDQVTVRNLEIVSVDTDDNVIAVKADNAAKTDIAPISADFTFFGGIYRGVSLTGLDLLGARMGDSGGPGVYLRQRSLSDASASVEVTTKAWNNRLICSSVMPMPLSLTANRSRWWWPTTGPVGATVIETPSCSVNFTPFPTRFTST